MVIWSKRRKEGSKETPCCFIASLRGEEHEDRGMFQKSKRRDSQEQLKPIGRKERRMCGSQCRTKGLPGALASCPCM